MAENPWTEGIEPSADHRNQSETNRLWSVMERTLAQSIIEQRRARRWGIFFKTITLGYVIGISLFVVNQSNLAVDAIGSQSHTAVVPIDGVIAPGETANAFEIQQNLEAAFEAPGSKGVML